eukprot:m.80145 g.80145  ORF g.80145 m.80145 type:complete len:296 (+) comp8026_c0_seq1:33-920(+)
MAATADASAAEKRFVTPCPPYHAPGADFKPNYTLDEKRTKVLAEFRAKIHGPDLPAADKEYCDDPCLCRYLRARDWEIPAAEKLLRGTLAWRREYGVEALHPNMIEEECKTGKLYIHGFDRNHRPVMYQKPRYQNTNNHADQVKQVVYFLEREMACMDKEKGVEQHVILIDFKGYSLLNAPPMHVTREVMTVLMDRFPERLGNAFMVDAPMLFNMAWRILRPFIPKATQDKVHFVSRSGTHGRNGKMDKVLAQFFDDDQLEEEYGGTLPSTYDHSEYWRRELAIHERWRGAVTAI